MNELTHLRVDIQYLAKRYKIIEDAFLRQEENDAKLADAFSEWSKGVSNQLEFMFNEFAQLYFKVHKQNKSFSYYKESLKDKFMADFEKFETLFSKVKFLDKKRKHFNVYT